MLKLKDLPREKRGRLLEVLQSEHVWSEQQKKATRHYNEALNGAFVESDVATCLTLKQDVIAHGPCNCVVCANKTSVTAPQVQFRKNRHNGFIDIYKEYQLVVNKRWLSCSDEMSHLLVWWHYLMATHPIISSIWLNNQLLVFYNWFIGV